MIIRRKERERFYSALLPSLFRNLLGMAVDECFTEQARKHGPCGVREALPQQDAYAEIHVEEADSHAPSDWPAVLCKHGLVGVCVRAQSWK